MEREGVITLSIRSYLWALRGLLIFKIPLCFMCLKMFGKFLSVAICFVLTLVSVLKSVNKANVLKICFLKCFCVGAKSCFEQTSNNYLLLYLKRFVIFLLPFRQRYPTISE